MIRIPAPSDEDRRAQDKSWKLSVDRKLEEGVAKFSIIEQGQAELMYKLEENTRATEAIQSELEAHVARYSDFVVKVQPAVDAIQTMQAGVRVLGALGGVAVWFGKATRKVIVWVTPIFAFFAAIWGFTHERGVEFWRAIGGWFK